MKFIKKDKNMRLFVYKTLFIFICILIVFKLTIGNLINTFENRIKDINSKENINIIKEKIRDELNDSLNKEQILNKEDAILLKKFLNKIQKEISNAY